MATIDKAAIIGDNKVHDGDTGSADVQVAILTHRINHLTEHLKEFKKDHSSRRVLIRMVSRRRKLLYYLNRKYSQRYKDLIKRLKIRK
ncbi:MAG: 30S ribosomal protein S15 [Verrucomicrobiota bacterium]